MLKMSVDIAKLLGLKKHEDIHGLSFPVFRAVDIPCRVDDHWYDWPVDNILLTEIIKGPENGNT